MKRADLDPATEWAAVEGWSPGPNDATGFHATDPAGILMGILGDGPVASISAVRYSSESGFLVLYKVAY